MPDEGMAAETVKLANKEHRAYRIADEILAVFARAHPWAWREPPQLS
jgi:hypothetical protein